MNISMTTTVTFDPQTEKAEMERFERTHPKWRRIDRPTFTAYSELRLLYSSDKGAKNNE